jgi:hypothetical protein
MLYRPPRQRYPQWQKYTDLHLPHISSTECAPSFARRSSLARGPAVDPGRQHLTNTPPAVHVAVTRPGRKRNIFPGHREGRGGQAGARAVKVRWRISRLCTIRPASLLCCWVLRLGPTTFRKGRSRGAGRLGCYNCDEEGHISREHLPLLAVGTATGLD